MRGQTTTQTSTFSIRAHRAMFALAQLVAAAGLVAGSAQAQIIIAPTVMSYSSYFGNRSPFHLVDGSGLTAGASGILGAADSVHGNDVDSSMWYASPFTTPRDATPFVYLDLGAVYDLQTTRLWQFNQSPEGFTVYGAAEVELSVSADDTNNMAGLTPTLFPTRGSGAAGEPAQDFATPSTGVRYIKLQIWASFAGTTEAPGLSEVRFVVDANTAPPVVTSQPTNQTVAAGGEAAFSVSAVGPGTITYQWRQDGVDLTDGANVSGAKTSTLTVSNVGLAAEGEYDVVLTNANGPAYSAKAILAIGNPLITQQPLNAVTIIGNTASLTVVATDFGSNSTGLVYQWRRDGTNISDAGKVSGTTTTNLVVVNVDSSDNGGYSVQVTDTLGKTTVSRTAALTAAQLPAVNLSMVINPIVTPTIESATSWFDGRTPLRMVDGSGLTAGLSGILGAADSVHSADAGQMWYANVDPADKSPIIIFNLGGAYDLQTTRIWNYNEAGGFPVYGAKNVEFAYSVDNITYTGLATNVFGKAGGTNGEPAQDISTPVTGVKYVRLHILDTFGGEQVPGLSEVRFVASGSKVSVVINNGVVGLHYRVDYADALPDWKVLQDVPSLPTNPYQVNDPAPMGAQAARFYRAVLIP